MTTSKRWKIAQISEKAYWQSYEVTTWKKRRDAVRYFQYVAVLKRYVKIESKTNTLDIGCGPDGMINYIDGQRFGMDPLMDYYFLEFQMSKHIIWIKGIGEVIPLKDECLDVLISTNSLDHSQNPALVLKEMNRILKKKGILFLTVNCYGPITRIIRRIEEKILSRIGKADQCHPHTFSSKDLIKQLRNSDFAIEGHLIKMVEMDNMPHLRTKVDFTSYLHQCRKNPVTPFHTFARLIDDRASYHRIDMIFVAFKQ